MGELKLFVRQLPASATCHGREHSRVDRRYGRPTAQKQPWIRLSAGRSWSRHCAAARARSLTGCVRAAAQSDKHQRFARARPRCSHARRTIDSGPTRQEADRVHAASVTEPPGSDRRRRSPVRPRPTSPTRERSPPRTEPIFAPRHHRPTRRRDLSPIQLGPPAAAPGHPGSTSMIKVLTRPVESAFAM